MKKSSLTSRCLKRYLDNRPAFLSLLRAREAELFSGCPLQGKPVLDLGCGDGFFAGTVFDRIDVGLDVPESRINEAERTGVYKQTVKYDGGIIPFGNKYFGCVISNCVLEHVLNLNRTIKEVYRTLKPGGRFVTTVMAKPWEDNLMWGDRYKRWMRHKQVHINLLSERQWTQIFERAGFEVRQKLGYLSPAACRLMDIMHYFSLPSLICYKLTGKWVLWPGLNLFPVAYFNKIMHLPVSPADSGAIFYHLEKPNHIFPREESL